MASAAIRPHVRGAPALAMVAIAAGVAVRIEQYLIRRSLWLDEASLALNIVHRDFVQLLKPLSYEQGAPFGFLWLERTVVLVLGNNEYALRLVPLAAGVASLLLFHRLARRVLDPHAAVVAMALFAISPALIRYSTEVKQYSSDVFFTLLVLLPAVEVLRDGPRREHVRALAWRGALAIWCSHAAILVLGGILVLLGGPAVVRRHGRELRPFLPLVVVLGASVIIDWLVSLRHLTSDPVLRAFWAAGFPPRGLNPLRWARWLLVRVPAVMHVPGNFAIPWLTTALAVIGLLVLGRGRPRHALLLAAVVGVTLVAAMTRHYPFSGRLVLFLLPVLVLAIAATLGASRLRPLVAIAVCVVALGPLDGFVRVAGHPARISELRPVLQYVAGHRRAGDAIDLFHGAEPAFLYYAPALGLPADDVLVRTAPLPPCRDVPLPRRPGVQRLWIVYGYHFSAAPPHEQRDLFALADRLWPRMASVRRHGVEAAAYAVSAPLTRAASASCLTALPAPPVVASGLYERPFGSGRRT